MCVRVRVCVHIYDLRSAWAGAEAHWQAHCSWSWSPSAHHGLWLL